MDNLRVGPVTIPAADLEERFETSGGPGGQHANRAESAVRLRFNVADSSLEAGIRQRLESRLGGIIEVVASDSRSQFRNRALARQRLKEKIEGALVDLPQRRATRPTRASKKRRVSQKRARGRTKRLRRRPGIDE